MDNPGGPGAGWHRAFLACAAAALGLAAVIQIGSWGLYNADAHGLGLPRLVPYRAGVVITERIAALPGFAGFRATLAHAALAHNDVATAQRLLAELPPGPERAEIAGSLALRSGDLDVAIDDYLAAGDAEAVEAEVERLDATRSVKTILAARRLQARLVERLGRSMPLPESYAEAMWLLGRLDSEIAYVVPEQRVPAARRALAEYRLALAQRPLSVKYLLNAANAAARVGDDGEAAHDFERVLAIDRTSVDARVGLGFVALRRGDVTAAGRELAEAERLSPHDPGVEHLHAALAERGRS